ncbi:beta-glucosidase [Natranaerovirga pectinivora]|uniref:Beta-glucosidase n=1 Tax=Natranaerovirga pectinivora TaxID=682400 RepID=A0A4R3MQJ4_9FIRM|nr:glycoside hydrolase family 3 C-terminal domain-containing protein [Natranaerovirga pectinivora]TCT17162.1 beta-glucosidase [Natranaerovirga pectinivora]
MNIKELIKSMTLEEKAALCSGKNFWSLESIERLNIPSIMMTDGPHGLRKQASNADHMGLNKSVPATCFPTAVTTASSWDRELLQEIGEALGEECLQEGVSVILGPGANIKRSPLCGRNFEYISEDPYLTGEMAAAMITGIQSKGIGTSLKHYAVNNQEKRRMVIDSIVDERTLREIYLSGFETAVKKSQPWTVMGAYNKLYGTYCCENKKLLKDVLRDEWGYDGLVLTDWGACNDRVEGLKVGLDLEMPSSNGLYDKQITQAVKNSQLDEKILNRTVERILNLIFKCIENKYTNYKYDSDAHHTLAIKAAAQSMVLLKNDDSILPLSKDCKLAIIGEFAKSPRYQGAGSSRINPTKLENVFDELTHRGINFAYSKGYDCQEDTPNEELINEACKVAAEASTVVIFAGLTDRYESEGFDREHMRMPESHNHLIKRIAKENQNVIVVLSGGSPVEMPWFEDIQGLVNTYLSGQGGASAVLDVLFGDVNPSGKLAETYPINLSDTPSYHYFAKGRKTAEYRESIYVGYRYYDTAYKDVLFPFGFGLSYTQFQYSDMTISKDTMIDTEGVTLSLKVKNVGKVAGAEVIQLYIKDQESTIFRPEKELKGFVKVYLEPGMDKTIHFVLNKRSFAYYNINIKDWHVEEGFFDILIGASSRDIRLKEKIFVRSSQPNVLIPDYRSSASVYYNLKNKDLEISHTDFESLYGKPLPPSDLTEGEYTINSSLEDVSETFFGKILVRSIKRKIKEVANTKDENDVTFRMMWLSIFESPLRTMVQMGDGALSMDLLNGLLKLINRKYFKGFFMLLCASFKKNGL